MKQLRFDFDAKELPAELRSLFHVLVERTRMEPELPAKRPVLKAQVQQIERKKA